MTENGKKNTVKIPISEDIMLLCGDVDSDGETGIIDATYIQRYNVGFNTPYPIGDPIDSSIETPTESPTETPTVTPTQTPTEKPTVAPTYPPTDPTSPTVAILTGDFVFKYVDKITPGKEYLIVNKNVAGDAYALKNDGGSPYGTSMNKAEVTVKSADVDKDGAVDLYITKPITCTVWAVSVCADGYSLTNNGDYIEGKSGNLKIFSNQQYPERYWTYNNQQLIFDNPATGDRATDYTLYFSSGNFTQSTSSNSNKIYIYEKTAVDEVSINVEPLP